jgi:hypothetical protein
MWTSLLCRVAAGVGVLVASVLGVREFVGVGGSA